MWVSHQIFFYWKLRQNISLAIISQKTGVEGWIIFKPTMWKCDRARNQTWDLPIIRGMLCHLSYLGMVTRQAHSRIIRVGYSSHSTYRRLERWEREIPQTMEKSTESHWILRYNISSTKIITENWSIRSTQRSSTSCSSLQDVSFFFFFFFFHVILSCFVINCI